MANKKINFNKNSYIYGLLITSLLIAIVVGYMVIKPIIDDNKKQQSILDNRKKVVKTLEDKNNKLKDLSSKSQDLKEKVENIDKAVPLNEDKKGIAYQIYSVASENSVSIESIRDDVNSIDAVESASSDLASILGVNPINLTISGKASYQGVIDFLDTLKKSLRLMSVSVVSFSGSDSDSLDFSISIMAYTRGEVGSNEQL